MIEPESTFCVGYVNRKIWGNPSSPRLASKWGYIPISENLIKVARNIVYEKGVRVAIIDPGNREIKLLEDYLFQGNLVRIYPLLTARPVPMWGPDIELHSETEKGLTKLIKDLGFPNRQKSVSQK